jgi:c-di-GMP-related signal transduction protein
MPPPPHPSAAAVHVGRQAVYDRSGAVHGYELLFRVDAEATEATERGAYATSQVLVSAFTEIGLPAIAGDRLCFVNLTREFLVGELPLPFGPDQVVLEVLETVTVDDEVVAGVGRLAGLGFAIALDDFVPGPSDRLLPLATYVKIDILDADPAALADTVRLCRRHPRIRLVAERVETADELRGAREHGFEYLQGYALSRPEVTSTVALAPSPLGHRGLLGMQLTAALPAPAAIALVTGDPALSMRILAAANADPLGVPVTVSSIHDATLLLGPDRVRDWAALMLVSDQHRADEPAVSAVMSRARMCQRIGERLNLPAGPAFTVGLLSAAAELLHRSPADIAPRLPLNAEIVDALTTGAGPLGELLALVHAYEASDLPTLIQ